VYVYQMGFDPAKSDLSPGRLHVQASIMRAIEDGHRFFDFLRGDEPYKAHFRATPIGVLETRLIAPRMSSLLGHRLWKSRQQIKCQMRAQQERRSCLGQAVSIARKLATRLSVTQPTACREHIALAPQPQPVEVRKTRWRNFNDACSRFGVSSAVIDLAYRTARRVGHLQVVNLVSLNLADLSPAPPLSCGLESRWLTADEVRAYAADPTNDLDASMASRLENARNYCHAIVDGSRLANYSWYALESIEPEHSLGIGLVFPLDTVYLYKAYTHPDYRGQRIHHAAIASAAPFFARQGISQLIAVIECANWASLRSHARLGCGRVGQVFRLGRPPLQFQHYPRLAEKLGFQSSAARSKPW